MAHAIQKLATNYTAWVPTFPGGFSVSPTVTARYILIGKMCHWWITASGHGTGSGTSASGTTFTLPFTAYNGTSQRGSGITVRNNTTDSLGVWVIASNSNVATVYRDGTLLLAWTDAVNRSFSGSGVYEIA